MHSCIVRWPLVEYWITCEWYKPIRLGSSRRKRAFIENAVGAEDAVRPPGQIMGGLYNLASAECVDALYGGCRLSTG